MIDCIFKTDKYKGETRNIIGRLLSRGKNIPELNNMINKKTKFIYFFSMRLVEEIATMIPKLDENRIIGIIYIITKRISIVNRLLLFNERVINIENKS